MTMLLSEIQKFCRDHHMSHNKFGLAALSDYRFVAELEMGRTPTARVQKKVRAFMDEFDNRAPVRIVAKPEKTPPAPRLTSADSMSEYRAFCQMMREGSAGLLKALTEHHAQRRAA